MGQFCQNQFTYIQIIFQVSQQFNNFYILITGTSNSGVIPQQEFQIFSAHEFWHRCLILSYVNPLKNLQ